MPDYTSSIPDVDGVTIIKDEGALSANFVYNGITGTENLQEIHSSTLETISATSSFQTWKEFNASINFINAKLTIYYYPQPDGHAYMQILVNDSIVASHDTVSGSTFTISFGDISKDDNIKIQQKADGAGWRVGLTKLIGTWETKQKPVPEDNIFEEVV